MALALGRWSAAGPSSGEASSCRLQPVAEMPSQVLKSLVLTQEHPLRNRHTRGRSPAPAWSGSGSTAHRPEAQRHGEGPSTGRSAGRGCRREATAGFPEDSLTRAPHPAVLGPGGLGGALHLCWALLAFISTAGLHSWGPVAALLRLRECRGGEGPPVLGGSGSLGLTQLTGSCPHSHFAEMESREVRRLVQVFSWTKKEGLLSNPGQRQLTAKERSTAFL